MKRGRMKRGHLAPRDKPPLAAVALVRPPALQVTSDLAQVLHLVLKSFDLQAHSQGGSGRCRAAGRRGGEVRGPMPRAHLLIHVALVVLPGPGGLVDLPLAVHRVVQQDVAPEGAEGVGRVRGIVYRAKKQLSHIILNTKHRRNILYT